MIESGLHDYLFDAMKAGASDLHVTVGLPPMIRVHGKVQPLEYPTLTPNATGALGETHSPAPVSATARASRPPG